MAIFKTKFETEGLDKTKSAMKSLSKESEISKQAMDKVNDASKNLTREATRLTSGINVLGFSMNTLLDTAVAFDGKTEGLGLAISGFKTKFNNSQRAGDHFFTSLQLGFEGAFKSGAKLKGILMTSLLPLALLAGAVYTLRKVWDNNIGGIQTKFQEFMGQVKQLWYEFEANFIEVLRTLEPIFTFFFSQLSVVINGLAKLLGGIFKGIGAIIKPFIDAFNEIREAFSFLSNDTSKAANEFNIFAVVASTLGKIFEVLGKTIGFVLKFTLLPIVKAFEGLAKIIEFISNAWKNLIDRFRETTVFKSVMNIFETIRDVIEKLISTINRIPGINIPTDGLDAAENMLRGESSRTTNNDNRTVNIHTSREISGQGARDFESMLAMNLDRM